MAHDDYHDLLAGIPLFHGLDRHDLEFIGKATTLLELDAGEVLMREGSVAHEMVIIVEGTLEVTRRGEHVADLGPGEFAGEMALLTRNNRNSTVAAKSDVKLLHIEGRSFASVLEEAPQIAVRMLPTVAARVTANSTSAAS